MPDQLSSLCLTNAADPYGFAPCALPHNASLSATPQPTYQPQPVDMALPITAGVAALCVLVSAFFLLYTLNRRGHVSNIALRALRKSGVLSAQTVAHMSASMGYGASGEEQDGEPDGDEAALQPDDPNMREVSMATRPSLSMRAVGIAAPETVNSEQALQQNEERVRWGPTE